VRIADRGSKLIAPDGREVLEPSEESFARGRLGASPQAYEALLRPAVMRGATLRLKPLHRNDLVGEQIALYDALLNKSMGKNESSAINDTNEELRGPLAVLLRHPASGRPLQELGAVLRFSGQLPDAAREAIILVVAAHWNDEHEWNSHERIARQLGMNDDQLVTLHASEEVVFDDPVTQAAFDAAHGIVTHGDLTDEEYARVQEVLGDERLVEVTVVIGYYSLLAMQLRVFRVPPKSAS
jgi:4-carboxymuconolactone decarboxylase